MNKKELQEAIKFRTWLIEQDIKGGYWNNLNYDIKQLEKLVKGK